MDKTNYPLLSIVAIVAITAIVAIFLFARAGSGITPPADAVSGLFSLDITGRVTAGEQRAPAPEGNRLDLNGDGKLSAADAEVLGLVIDRAQFCPRNKRCDLNGDSQINMEDLGLLNSEILKQPQAGKHAYVPTPAPARKEIDPALSVAAFGGIA